jgi:hypothetical protein
MSVIHCVGAKVNNESVPDGEKLPLLKGDYYSGACGPTIILIMSSPAAGVWLQQVFRELACREPARTLTAEPEVRIANLKDIEMIRRPDGPRVALRYRDGEADSLVWSATEEGWLYLADLIQSLCDGGIGHHYLTEDKDDVALIELSSGEEDVLSVARSRLGDNRP